VIFTAQRGRPPETGASSPFASSSAASAFARAVQPDYLDWLSHVWPAAGCANPVRLRGTSMTVDASTGEVLRQVDTDDVPDGVIYKPCGNRRACECPSCAEVYRRDAFQVIRSGLAGGKGVPESVASHPAVFATFTAPSFGLVHSRRVKTHACADRSSCYCMALPCHARRDAGTCSHGRPLACYERHAPGDPLTGQPICPDCYDHDSHVVWNNAAGELWRRTKQAAERYLAALARRRGIPFVCVPCGADRHGNARYRLVPPARLSHGKAAEYQARGAVHFHALARLDGIDPDNPAAVVPPPQGLTAADLTDAIRYAAATVTFATESHPANPAGWVIGWGEQTDVRTVIMTGDGTVTDLMVAAYLAKYATKATEITGHASRRLTPATIELHADPEGTHVQRLINAAWQLGKAHGPMYGTDHGWDSLRHWAHMLGFGGHFLTKARRYSVTFRALRDARALHRRLQLIADRGAPEHCQDDVDAETIIVINGLSYDGSGWKTTGDALLANTAADLARSRQQAAREATRA
jgi:hypothetical protein